MANCKKNDINEIKESMNFMSKSVEDLNAKLDNNEISGADAMKQLSKITGEFEKSLSKLCKLIETKNEDNKGGEE